MRKDWSLTQDTFDRLLAWLDDDRERAGARYEAVRSRLTRIFMSRGCQHAEDLADETINRVGEKLGELAGSYSGDPALFFYGVANNVHKEYLRRNARVQYVPTRVADERIEDEHACLESCLDALPADTRALLLEYYREDRHAKIEKRREMADRQGVSVNTLGSGSIGFGPAFRSA